MTDPSGQTFYFNKRTGQSQYEPPQFTTKEAQRDRSGQWYVFPAFGVCSEYSVRTGEQQVLGCYDLLESKPAVAEVQCVLQVAADGTATLVSLGHRPTGLRAHQGAPWYGLKRDATHVLAHGEQIALDDERTAVFTCQADGADVAMGYPPQQGFVPQPGGYPQQGGYPPPQGGYPGY